MSRFLLNPTFDIETGKLLSHDGEFFEEPKILFDRGLAQNASSQGKNAAGVGAGFGSTANTIGSSLIPGLIRQSQNPQGLTATQLNNATTASGEAAGGANANATSTGGLQALRTKTAGGFGAALDEAARNKGRTLATNAQNLQLTNAKLGLQRQQEAQQQLQGLYGTDTSNQLKAMGLQSQDLQDQLAANRQGWLQNTDQTIQAIGSLGGGVGAAAKGITG